MDPFEELLHGVAEDLGWHPSYLNSIFVRYIQDPQELQVHEAIACYALYRLAKLTGAMEMTNKSRSLWKARALAEGWEGDEDKDDPINEIKAER